MGDLIPPPDRYTEEHAQALRVALATGEHRVSYDGKSIEYRSVSDLKAALAEVESALARQLGISKSRQICMNTAKGLQWAG